MMKREEKREGRKVTFVLEGVIEDLDLLATTRDAEDALSLLSSDLIEIVNEGRKCLDRDGSSVSHRRFLGLAESAESVAEPLANARAWHDEGHQGSIHLLRGLFVCWFGSFVFVSTIEQTRKE